MERRVVEEAEAPNINSAGGEDADGEEVLSVTGRSIGESVVSQYRWSRGMDRVDYVMA